MVCPPPSYRRVVFERVDFCTTRLMFSPIRMVGPSNHHRTRLMNYVPPISSVFKEAVIEPLACHGLKREPRQLKVKNMAPERMASLGGTPQSTTATPRGRRSQDTLGSKIH